MSVSGYRSWKLVTETATRELSVAKKSKPSRREAFAGRAVNVAASRFGVPCSTGPGWCRLRLWLPALSQGLGTIPEKVSRSHRWPLAAPSEQDRDTVATGPDVQRHHPKVCRLSNRETASAPTDGSTARWTQARWPLLMTASGPARPQRAKKPRHGARPGRPAQRRRAACSRRREGSPARSPAARCRRSDPRRDPGRLAG